MRDAGRGVSGEAQGVSRVRVGKRERERRWNLVCGALVAGVRLLTNITVTFVVVLAGI